MSLTLITHNAYWFQGSPSLWGEERVQTHSEVLDALIAFYRQLEPDLLCLQEVPSQEICDEVATGLGMRSHYVQGGGRAAYGGAVLWCALDGVVDDLTHTVVDGERFFERICLALKTVVSGIPLVVLNLHLSSNRFAPLNRPELVRLAEIEALFEVCAQPDVVAGDFNARPDSVEYATMIERGYVDCGAQLSANRCHVDERIDYIWVREDSAVNALELAVTPDSSFSLAGERPVDLSDHPAVGVQLTW